MDIEEYLRQKRELESKKEVLEAKTKFKETNEKIKKEQHTEPRPKEGYQSREPALKPWMIWDIIILLIVLVLFSVIYFNPSYDKDIDDNKINQNLATGQATVSTETALVQEQNQEDISESSEESDNNESEQSTVEESLPGPDFSIKLRDKVLGEFDDDGKLNGEILVLEVENGYYKDAIVSITNGENAPIKCKVEKDIQIDTDFDNQYDSRDMGKLGDFEFDPNQKKDIKDTIPGEVEIGSYGGQGRFLVDYQATCVFCLDEDCEGVEENAKSEDSAMFKIMINPQGSSSSNGNNTNSSS